MSGFDKGTWQSIAGRGAINLVNQVATP